MAWEFRTAFLLALSFCAPVAQAGIQEEQQYLLSVVPLIQSNDLPAAEQKLREGLQLHPRSAILENALGIVYERQQKPDEAISAFERALKQLPSFTAAQLHLATLYRQRSRTKEAAELFAAAGEGTSNFEAVVAAALGLGECDDYARAARLWEKADTVSPGSSSVAYNLALARYHNRDYRRALETLQSSALKEPDALYLRGKVREALGAPEASQDLASACRASSGSQVFCLDAGIRLIRDENFSQAAELLEEGVRREPASVPLLAALGLAQFRLGRYEDAIRSYGRALDADPRLDAAREGLVFLLYMTGNLEKARSIAEQGLGNRDADFFLWHLDAMVIYRQCPDCWAESERAVNRALDKRAGFAPAYFLRGKIAMGHGNFDAALKDFARAVELDPKYPLPYFKMSQIYLRQGRDAEAEKAQQRFRELGSLREEEVLTRQAQDLLMPAAAR